MNFRTDIQPLSSQPSISHSDRILMLGSCFTDNIGAKLDERLFTVLANPFGSLYNPASIAATVSRIVDHTPFSQSDIQRGSDGLWFSYCTHTKLNSPDAGDLLQNLNSRLDAAHSFVKKADVACITLGTAWAFSLNATGSVVANCQKQPASLFTRHRMSVNECTQAISRTVEQLRSVHPDIRIILTVSPIRHLADGAHGNQLSKSTLLLACEQAANATHGITYFPAYEIMMDDLRDYRFYASDMKHPSDTAINYIYELFAKSFFSNDTIELSRQALSLTRRLNHHPLTSGSGAAEKFRSDTLHLITSLAQEHPELKHHELFHRLNSTDS